jgi:hypothetical protein
MVGAGRKLGKPGPAHMLPLHAGYRVEAMAPPGMAPQDTQQSEPATGDRAMPLDSLEGITRAGGEVSTAVAHDRREKIAIE